MQRFLGFRWRRSLASVSLGIVVLVIVGCSRSEFESQVSGKVMLDGKGVGPGTIIFAIQGAETGNPATGAIDASGNYSLKTSRAVGLKSGHYRVCVTVFEPTQGQPGERVYGPSKWLTPQKYGSLDTSGLEYDVKAGSNAIDIELSSK
jgi:hypothetical protein